VTDRATGLAVHVGADVLASPQHRDWPPVRSCRDTLARMTRLCASAGVDRQECLAGPHATLARVRSAIAGAAATLAPDGLLVLTFAGHSERARPGTEAGWCLVDGTLTFAGLAAALAGAPPSACVIVVAATCYAAALARHPDWPCTVVLLAACDDYQIVLNSPRSEFIQRLEAAAGATDYTSLRDRLCHDTPDAERPRVWTNSQTAWSHRPFRPIASPPTHQHR
jgi:hypothetical protein